MFWITFWVYFWIFLAAHWNTPPTIEANEDPDLSTPINNTSYYAQLNISHVQLIINAYAAAAIARRHYIGIVHVNLLLLCGDIESQPGPAASQSVVSACILYNHHEPPYPTNLSCITHPLLLGH